MPKITVLEDSKNNIVKQVLDKSPNITDCKHIWTGKGYTKSIQLSDFPELILSLTPKQCLCLGIVKGGMEEYEIGREGITRTSSCFEMPNEPGFMLFDFDNSGFSMQEGIDFLRHLDPALKTCGVVGIYSSSSLIFDSESGREIKGKGNFHLYFAISNMSKMQQYGNILFDKTIILGHGKVKIKKNNGAKLTRSVFDKIVWASPEREVFEASPICCDGVVSKRLDEIYFEDGDILNIEKSVESLKLTAEEYIDYRLKEKALLEDPAIVKLSEIERKKRAVRLSNKKSKDGKDVRVSRDDKHMDNWTDSRGVNHCYLFTCDSIIDENAETLSILSLLEKGEAAHNMSLPDPDDPWKRGSEQSGKPGKGIAYVRYNKNGTMHIFSHYGDVEYHLMWDCDTIKNKIDNETDSREIDAFIDYVFDGNCVLDELEIASVAACLAKRNRLLAGQSTYGTDSRTIKTKLKSSVKTTVEDMKAATYQEVPDYVVELNARYGAVMLGGKAKIVENEFNMETNKWTVKISDIAQLSKHDEDNTVEVGDKVYPKLTAWNRHKAKNKFSGAFFMPNSDKLQCCEGTPYMIQQGGVFNFWGGYQVNFKFWEKGCSCEKTLWHFKNIWCGGHEGMYQYLLAWFSELFKNPARIGQPYLAMGSEPGAGKGFIISNLLNKLLGNHCIVISETNKLTGNFNAHLSNIVLAVLDEAVFAGDPRTKGVIKSFINEEKIKENKGVDATDARNFAKLIFCTNDEHIANLDLGDRRFVYLPIVDDKKSDRAYFREMEKEMENGGREAFLEMMLKFETDVDCNVLPEGQSDRKQADKLMSADVCYKFFFDLVSNGAGGYRDHVKLFKDWHKTPVFISKEVLFEMVCQYADKAREPRHYMDTTKMLNKFRNSGLYLGRKVSMEQRLKKCMFEKIDNFESVIQIQSRVDCCLILGIEEF